MDSSNFMIKKIPHDEYSMAIPKWSIPVVIIILLFIALTFRWQHGPTKTVEMQTAVFLVDNWTGQAWLRVYDFRADYLSIKIIPADNKSSYVHFSNPFAVKNIAIGIWFLMLGLSIFWFCRSLNMKIRLSSIPVMS